MSGTFKIDWTWRRSTNRLRDTTTNWRRSTNRLRDSTTNWRRSTNRLRDATTYTDLRRYSDLNREEDAPLRLRIDETVVIESHLVGLVRVW